MKTRNLIIEWKQIQKLTSEFHKKLVKNFLVQQNKKKHNTKIHKIILFFKFQSSQNFWSNYMIAITLS